MFFMFDLRTENVLFQTELMLKLNDEIFNKTIMNDKELSDCALSLQEPPRTR